MTTALPQVPELLRPLWQQRQGAIAERLERVEQALRDAPGADLPVAMSDAHKLRGVLGTFGFQEGSDIAGRAEDLLIADDPGRPGWIEMADQCAAFRATLTQGQDVQPIASTAEELK